MLKTPSIPLNVVFEFIHTSPQVVAYKKILAGYCNVGIPKVRSAHVL